MSFVHTAAARPYIVLFPRWTTSSASSTDRAPGVSQKWIFAPQGLYVGESP